MKKRNVTFVLVFCLLASPGRLMAFAEIKAPAGWQEVRQGRYQSAGRPSATAADRAAGFIAFTRNYMEPVYAEIPPKPDEVTGTFKIRLAKNEFEPVIVGLYALESRDDIHLAVRDLRSDRGKIADAEIEVRTIQYRAVLPPGRRKGGRQYRLIPSRLELGNKSALTKGRTAAFWLTLKAGIRTGTGVYRGDIIVTAKDKVLRKMALEVTVLPFELKEIPKKTFSALYTPAGLPPRMERNARILMKDMRDHGMTAYSPLVPAWGKPMDLSRSGSNHADMIANHLQWAFEEGFQAPTILNVQKLIRAGRPGLSAGYEKFDENIDIPNLKKLVAILEKTRNQKGWPEIIYLPIDEPGCFTDRAGTKREELAILLLRTLQELDVRAATTVADLVDKKHRRMPRWRNVVGWWDKIQPYTAVRIYLNGYPEGPYSLENEMADAAARGHTVMLYENTSTMGIDPAVSRMYFGFYGWHIGAAGITSWTHPTLGHATLTHAWADWKELRPLQRAYTRDAGWRLPPSTVCWEMVREGIDDAKYLDMFLRLSKENGAGSTKSARLIKELKREVGATGMTAKKPKCDWTGARFAGYRDRLVQAILELHE